MVATLRLKYFGIVFLLLLLPSHPAAANTVSNFRLTGEALVAEFDAIDPSDSCVENIVTVFASEEMQKISSQGNTTGVGVVVDVIRIYHCGPLAPIIIFEGNGIAPDVHDPSVPVPRLMVAGDLRTATLKTTVGIFDFVNGQGYYFQVDLAWTATDKATFTQAKEKFEDRDAGLKIVSQSRGFIAPALASGSVFGAGIEFTPDASRDASIRRDNFATVAIERAR